MSEDEGTIAKIQALEGAIRRNQAAKAGLPDCTCWANAPQAVDAELYRALDEPATGEERLKALEAAIQAHQQEKMDTPECTCWITPSRKADLALYAALRDLRA